MTHKTSTKRRVYVGGLVLALAATLSPVTAMGDAGVEAPPLEEAVSSALQSALGSSLDDSAPLTLEGSVVTHEGPGFVATTDLSEGQALRVQLESDEVADDEQLILAIKTSDLSINSELQDGLIVAPTQEDAYHTVTQPVESGVRIMHVIEERSAPVEYATRFLAGTPISPVLVESGKLFLHDTDGVYVGELEAPWAVDAVGVPVPTRYEWRDGTLVQIVDHHSGNFNYPIVADPEWTYNYNTSTTLPQMGVTATKAVAELRRCFNCSFPIAGAPVAYPAVGAILNLNASPITLIKIAAPVKVSLSTGARLAFLAQAGHFDGAGSTILFHFYQTCSGSMPTLRLSVNATVKKDNGAVVNAGNAAIAKTQWQNFMNKTYANTAARPGYVPGTC